MPCSSGMRRLHWVACALAPLLLLPGAASAQECEAGTVPRVSGVAPALVYAGLGAELTVSGNFSVFPDTVAECAFWQAGVFQAKSIATSVSGSTVRCALPPTVPVADTDLIMKVFRSSASNPDSNFCFSDEQAQFIQPGDFARFGVQTVECRAATIPRISGVSPGLMGEGQLIDLTVSGVFDTFPDSEGECIFFEEGLAPTLSAASSLSNTTLVCPLPAIVAPGEVDVIVHIFRSVAALPDAAFCFSYELNPRVDPGDSARFEIEPAAVECQARTVPRISAVVPALATEGALIDVAVAGTYAVFSDSVADCVFWQGGLVQDTVSASGVSASEIICPLPLLPPGETQVTIQVSRTSAASPGANACQSNEGSPTFDPGDSASLTISAAACSDMDGDGFCDDIDNCPRTYNPVQLDRGGKEIGVPDGVGDLCQNGDWNADGQVELLDVILERRRLVDLEPEIDPAMPPQP